MEGLPYDVFYDILSRLPLSSLLQCKLVSRLFYSSVKHPLVTSMHLSRPNDHNPFLICFSVNPTSKLDLVDLSSSENDIFLARTPNLPFESTSPDFSRVGSCNGLLCLYNRTRDNPLFIYNPFTREFKELPKLISPPHLNVLRIVFGFGFHPRTKEYKVLKIVYYKEENNLCRSADKETKVHVLKLGDSEWRHIRQKPCKLIARTIPNVLVNGNLHWLSNRYQTEEKIRRDIISFDLATEEFEVIPQPCGLGLNKFPIHFLPLNDCLSAVVSGPFGENEIWVLKDYMYRSLGPKNWLFLIIFPGVLEWTMLPLIELD